MKFDKDWMIMILICGAVLFGWTPFARYMGWMPASGAPVQSAPAQVAATPPKPVPVTPFGESVKPVAQVKKESKLPELPPVVMENELVKFNIQPNRGVFQSIELKKYQMAKHGDAPGANIVLDATVVCL